MSQAGTLNHDTAARLLGLAPGELDALVKAGAVRRMDRNAYALPVLVQDYIGHLKAERERADLAPAQAEIAAHLDMSDRSVRELLTTLGIDHKLSTLTEIRVAYIRKLREAAAGRATNGDLDLATERAALARAQRERIEMENAERRGQLARVDLIEPQLEDVFASARAFWINEPQRIANSLPGVDAVAVEEQLQAAFEAFLIKLSRWTPAQLTIASAEEDDAD